jgi:hypothetical protein
MLQQPSAAFSVLFNTRNAVTNHLAKFILINNEAQRVMRNTLKEGLTQKAPLQAVGVYEEVIKQVQRGLRAALQIIHNFVHEDRDTLKMAPLRSNVEYTYFTVAFITRYIAYQLHY